MAAEGSCGCGAATFAMTRDPMFVQCCHCTRCQRQSGSAFALNAMVEADAVTLRTGSVEEIEVPSESGRGQTVTRCTQCKTALWSIYGGAGPKFRFVRVGALADPSACPPNIHIFTASKQPWVKLPEDTPAVPAFYDRAEVWPAESLERLKAALA